LAPGGQGVFNRGVPSQYRLSRPLVARLTGVLLATLGVLILVIAALVALVSLPALALTVAVVVSVLAVAGAALLLGRGTVVALGEDGYRVRFVRGAGVPRAGWTQVESVSATTMAGERYVVLTLKDGRTTTVPVRLLEGRPDDFVRDLQEHLNRGYGYRRIA
jgi:hypothetical protein